LHRVLAFLLEYFDGRIRSGSDVESRTGTSVLAVVPKLGLLERLRSRGSVLKSRENGAAVSAFRRLRARLLAHGIASRGGVLVVASLYDGEESAVIVARLAVALARANFRTLLISLDVRHHRMEKLLQMQCDSGLTDILMDYRAALECCHRDRPRQPVADPGRLRHGRGH
jgi:Mrp family chromosome partitioning ATPase